MKKILWTVVLLGAVAAASAAAWRWREHVQQNALPAGIVSGNGRVESTQVDIAAKYGGRIKEILAREGDLVEPGQVLVRMDTSELVAELAKDRATVAENEESAAGVKTEIAKDDSQLKLAEAEYKRSYDLLSRRAIAREEFDRYKTRLETAKAALDGSNAKLKAVNQSISAAQAVVTRTEARIEDATLKSPVRGRVLYRLAEPAEVVALGGKVLTLINLSDIYMEIYLPAQEAARVKIGADARIVLDARPGYAARGGRQLCLPRGPVHPQAGRDAERARQADVPGQAPGAVRGDPALHRAGQDRRPGRGLRPPRRRGRLARPPGTPSPRA